MVGFEAGIACYLHFTPKNKSVESGLEGTLSFEICDHLFPCFWKVIFSLDTHPETSDILEIWQLKKIYEFLALIFKNIFVYFLFLNIWVEVKNSLNFGS